MGHPLESVKWGKMVKIELTVVFSNGNTETYVSESPSMIRAKLKASLMVVFCTAESIGHAVKFETMEKPAVKRPRVPHGLLTHN